MTERRLERPFRLLRQRAHEEERSLHLSFFEELENYARHKRVEDLPDADLEKVVLAIGEHALERASEREVGAKRVRVTLDELCPDPFTTCFEAARGILAITGEAKLEDVEVLLDEIDLDVWPEYIAEAAAKVPEDAELQWEEPAAAEPEVDTEAKDLDDAEAEAEADEV